MDIGLGDEMWPTSHWDLTRSNTGMDFMPNVDIKEDDKQICICCDLPGLKKEDVKVRLENGLLTIEGEKKEDKEEKDIKWHRVERFRGKFSRSFQLPDNVDQDNLKAKFNEGCLNISVNKLEKKKETGRTYQIE